MLPSDVFPDTPEHEKFMPAPQAHRAVIEGVVLETARSTGRQYVKIIWSSRDTGLTDSVALFSYGAFARSPSSHRTILEILKKLALEQGREFEDAIEPFDDWLKRMSKLLTGLEVVAYLAADGANADDPQYAHRLKTRGFLSIKTAENPNCYLPPVRRMWE